MADAAKVNYPEYQHNLRVNVLRLSKTVSLIQEGAQNGPDELTQTGAGDENPGYEIIELLKVVFLVTFLFDCLEHLGKDRDGDHSSWRADYHQAKKDQGWVVLESDWLGCAHKEHADAHEENAKKYDSSLRQSLREEVHEWAKRGVDNPWHSEAEADKRRRKSESAHVHREGRRHKLDRGGNKHLWDKTEEESCDAE